MKKISKIKRFLIIGLIFLMSINSFAAIEDNDGSAFITKAEFDSLKSNFQSQIDSYNNNIDSKIDTAIASYLTGISISNEQDLNSDLYIILKQNADTGFYNMNGTNPHNYFTYDPVVTFNGTYFIECGYKAVYYRSLECYTGYAVTQTLNAAIGNANNYILQYETIDGKKVYNKVISGLSYAYNLNRTSYFAGNDLYYGGYIDTLTFANNSLSTMAPGTNSTNDPSKMTAKTVGFSNASNATKWGFTYVKSGGWIPDHSNYDRYSDSNKTWGSWEVYTYTNTSKTPTDVAIGYRYDYKSNNLTMNIPLYDVNTSNYNIIDEQNSLDDKTSYETTTATLKNKLIGSFGGGALLNAVGLGSACETAPTKISATHSININKLKITKNQKPNTIYNRYIYDYYGLFLPNNEVYLPLVTNKGNKNGVGTFNLKPITTSGTLEIYENEMGKTSTTRIKISGKKVSDSASIGSDVDTLTLSNGNEYSINFNLLGDRNYMIKWVPSSDTIGNNKFSTSDIVKIKYI